MVSLEHILNVHHNLDHTPSEWIWTKMWCWNQVVERRPDLEYLLISHSRIGISRRWRCAWIRYPIRIFSHPPAPSQDPSWARKNPEILGDGRWERGGPDIWDPNRSGFCGLLTNIGGLTKRWVVEKSLIAWCYNTLLVHPLVFPLSRENPL